MFTLYTFIYEHLSWNIVLEMDTNGKYIQWCVSLFVFRVMKSFTLLSAVIRHHTAISNGGYTRDLHIYTAMKL